MFDPIETLPMVPEVLTHPHIRHFASENSILLTIWCCAPENPSKNTDAIMLNQCFFSLAVATIDGTKPLLLLRLVGLRPCLASESELQRNRVR